MSTDNERCLTADGRVLACTVPGDHDDDEMLIDLNGQHNSNTRGRSWMNHDGVTWPANAPCTWNATCVRCRGSGTYFKGQMDNDLSPCPTCGGTGVDETIPLRMIGRGSELRDLTGSDEGTFVIARFMKSLIGDRDGFIYYPDDGGSCWALVSEIGDSFEVVRAVPPAHTTPKGTR
jgi:hypothetical protein